MFYLVKTPGWLNKIYTHRIWMMPGDEKIMYLSFDDGPHPSITSFVLDELKKYNAKASFFCIGKNVLAYPGIYKRIIEEGHSIGNHSFSHLNGWKTGDALYLDDIAEAKKYIDSNLFRPPYGRISTFQIQQLSLARFNLKTVMWSVLSGDFDESISKERCLENVLFNAEKGSVIVFHDSDKASEKLRCVLPVFIKKFSAEGYQFKKITL